MTKVLIIEDDVVLNEMYSMKFKMEGFEVVESFDGTDGISRINDFKPDIILVDIMMPGINGFETVKQIRAMVDYDVKILMFTNLNDKQSVANAHEAGVDDFILKTDTTPKQAVEKIKEILKI